MDIQTSTPAVTASPVLTLEQLREIIVPEIGERVLMVPQCSYHLTDLADREGLVGLPEAAAAPFLSPQYGSPYWTTHRRYEPGIGYAYLVVRDGVFRKGPQNWDSGD